MIGFKRRTMASCQSSVTFSTFQRRTMAQCQSSAAILAVDFECNDRSHPLIIIRRAAPLPPRPTKTSSPVRAVINIPCRCRRVAVPHRRYRPSLRSPSPLMLHHHRLKPTPLPTMVVVSVRIKPTPLPSPTMVVAFPIKIDAALCCLLPY